MSLRSQARPLSSNLTAAPLSALQPTPRMQTYGSTSNGANATAGPSGVVATSSSSKGKDGHDVHKARPRVLFLGPRS